jgi:inosine-uridine nucleoside N-ribohydrolase
MTNSVALLTVAVTSALTIGASAEAKTMPAATTAVWIDTDPSVSSAASKEVDDGFALLQAFHSPELEIRGVSIVFGNAPLEQTWPIGREIVRRFGPAGLAVHAGAARAAQLGEETDASRALAAALRREPLTVLALGPVTNVATVLKNHPELSHRIASLVAVAGRRPGQQFRSTPSQPTPFPDLNFELDAPAFQVLLDADVPLALAPWEVSSTVWLNETDLQRMENAGAAAGWLVEPARRWLRVWKQEFGADGFNPFDTLAVGYVTSPHLIACEDLPATIEAQPDDALRTPTPGAATASKPYLLVGREIQSARIVRYCFSPAPGFKDDLMTRLLRGSGIA